MEEYENASNIYPKITTTRREVGDEIENDGSESGIVSIGGWCELAKFGSADVGVRIFRRPDSGFGVTSMLFGHAKLYVIRIHREEALHGENGYFKFIDAIF